MLLNIYGNGSIDIQVKLFGMRKKHIKSFRKGHTVTLAIDTIVYASLPLINIKVRVLSWIGGLLQQYIRIITTSAYK